jgi:hypothetical protein
MLVNSKDKTNFGGNTMVEHLSHHTEVSHRNWLREREKQMAKNSLAKTQNRHFLNKKFVQNVD